MCEAQLSPFYTPLWQTTSTVHYLITETAAIFNDEITNEETDDNFTHALSAIMARRKMMIRLWFKTYSRESENSRTFQGYFFYFYYDIPDYLHKAGSLLLR